MTTILNHLRPIDGILLWGVQQYRILRKLFQLLGALSEQLFVQLFVLFGQLFVLLLEREILLYPTAQEIDIPYYIGGYI